MWFWGLLLVLVLLGPTALRWWARRRARADLTRLPLYRADYSEAEAGSIPEPIRVALSSASEELTALGFELVGYMQSPEYGVAPPRFQAVLRNAAERAFAVLGFSLTGASGATVNFETLFDDGWWLRTVNRRGHFYASDYAGGRVDDPLAATVADQWQHHLAAVRSEEARAPRLADVPELLRHLNAIDDEEIERGLREGDTELIPGSGSAKRRYTSQGAERLIARLQSGAAVVARAPAPEGIFRMPIPAADLERRLQNVLFIRAETERSPGKKAFLVSMILFAASMLVMRRWSWILWLIPVLLLHELGHWGALRAFGHRDAKIRFIPFFGAATFSTTRFRKLSHELIVLLAGPVPGILLAFILLRLSQPAGSSYLVSAALLLISINGLNLLPFPPLDGGRIVTALFTAGRPHLDIVVRMGAAVLFVAAAVAFRDPTIGLLGVLVVLVVRSGRRLARLDQGIRRSPGYSPDMPATERRRLIFETLAQDPGYEAASWASDVQSLEASLNHVRPRWWQAAPWALGYAACLGAVIAWGANVMTIPARTRDCPTRAQARPVACGASASSRDVDWTRVDPSSFTRNPITLATTFDFPVNAFIWCAGTASATYQALAALAPVKAARGYCPALPWEALPAEGEEARTRARWTMAMLDRSSVGLGSARELAYIDDTIARLAKRSDFDVETARLYRAARAPGATDDHALAERLGPSPSRSCERFQIGGITIESIGEDDPGQPGQVTLKMSVGMATADELEPLRRYLCAAGCAVSVLPYGGADPRLHRCF